MRSRFAVILSEAKDPIRDAKPAANGVLRPFGLRMTATGPLTASRRRCTRKRRHHAARLPRSFFELALGSKVILSPMPVAFANRRKVDRVGVALPLSRRAMVDCDV